MSKTEVRQVTPEEVELWNQGPILEKLPVEWSETGFQLDNFIPQCCHCEAEITDPGLVRGTVTRNNDACITIKSIARCMECGGTLTNNTTRIRSSVAYGTQMERVDADGNWKIIQMKLANPVKAALDAVAMASGLKKRRKHKAELRG